MKVKPNLVVALCLMVLVGGTVFFFAPETSAGTPSFLEKGQAYEFGVSIASFKAVVLDTGSDSWIKVQSDKHGVFWLNLNQVHSVEVLE